MTAVAAAAPAADPPPGHLEVKPDELRPGPHDPRCQAEWSRRRRLSERLEVLAVPGYEGLRARTATRLARPSDPKDNENDGLVLDKMGPTDNNADRRSRRSRASRARSPKLGYDIRKYGPGTSARAAGLALRRRRAALRRLHHRRRLFFVGCSSPAAGSPQTPRPGVDPAALGYGHGGHRPGLSARRGLPAARSPGNVQHIYVVFDEGTDTGPDFFGAARPRQHRRERHPRRNRPGRQRAVDRTASRGAGPSGLAPRRATPPAGRRRRRPSPRRDASRAPRRESAPRCARAAAARPSSPTSCAR